MPSGTGPIGDPGMRFAFEHALYQRAAHPADGLQQIARPLSRALFALRLFIVPRACGPVARARAFARGDRPRPAHAQAGRRTAQGGAEQQLRALRARARRLLWRRLRTRAGQTTRSRKGPQSRGSAHGVPPRAGRRGCPEDGAAVRTPTRSPSPRAPRARARTAPWTPWLRTNLAKFVAHCYT